jgi:primosomal protein N'
MERTLLCSPAQAAQTVLPTATRYRLRAVIELVAPVPPLRSQAQRMTAEAIRRHGGRVSLATLKRELAAAIWQPGLRGLREKGCVRTVYELAPPPPPPRAEPWVEVCASPDALEAFFATEAARAPAQARLLLRLLEHPDGRLPRRALLEATGASLATLRALESRGLTRQVAADAEPIPPTAPPPTLTPAQQRAVDALRSAIQHGAFQAFLLYGVTGSGKTEVYLRAAAECLRTGRGVLFLAPEIALTAQLTQAFRERFGASIAVLHSQLSPTERYAQWLRIKQGDAPIVIGARSAVFAPLPNIGLIIIDEEHETAYKQSTAPTYHARTLAEARAREANAILLLGSATPALETFHRAERGHLRRLDLPERVGGATLPETHLIDLRGRPFQPISPELLDALRETLSAGNQANPVPEPTGLCADAVVSRVWLHADVPELLGVAGVPSRGNAVLAVPPLRASCASADGVSAVRRLGGSPLRRRRAAGGGDPARTAARSARRAARSRRLPAAGAVPADSVGLPRRRAAGVDWHADGGARAGLPARDAGRGN